MACIVKAPSSATKGVVVFTTQERDHQIRKDPALERMIAALKQDWLVGLHHNWHDPAFHYDSLFDFSMAGYGDLTEVDGADVPLVPMDACNFVPKNFFPGKGEKFWDVLFVARAVFFKRIPEFFKTIRALYDRGNMVRVLFICPVPPFDPAEKKTVLFDIREIYDGMFSEAERDLFNLLTIDYRYPFPFDLDTLGYFYRSSKVFVHTANDERRCRVAAYAWASGMPVVSMSCVASLLTPELQNPPYFFEAKDYRDFPDKIVEAIASVSSPDWDQGLVSRQFSETASTETFDGHLQAIAARTDSRYQRGKMWDRNLSIRLGRHHLGKEGPNSLAPVLGAFVAWLNEHNGSLEKYQSEEDPEKVMDAAFGNSGRGWLRSGFGRKKEI